MLNHCSCVAVVYRQSEVAEAKQLLQEINIDGNVLSVLSKKSQPADIDTLLTESGVPEGSRHCYQCVIEAGWMLCVVRGDSNLVEAAGDQLEKMNNIEISIHLDLPRSEDFAMIKED